MNLSDLKKPFPRNLISWRVGSTNKEKTKGIALAYIDARDVMERMDEVCGSANWQDRYPHANGKTCCEIDVYVEGRGWVTKSNGAGDTDFEGEKGAFSDAFKRAAVLWGVGRYLYDVPNIWVDIEPMGKSYKIKNPNDPKLLKALEQAEQGIRQSHEPEPEYSQSNRSLQAKLLTRVAQAKDKHDMQAVIDEIQKELETLPPEMQGLINQEIENRLNGFENGVTFPDPQHKFAGVNDANNWLKTMKPVLEGFKSTKALLEWQGNNQPWIEALDILGAEKYKDELGRSPKQRFTDALKAKYDELSNLELSQQPLAAE